MASLPLRLTIQTKEKVTFDGEIKSVSSLNKKGKFDVIPLHANFISLMNQVLIIRHVSGRKEEVKIDTGVLRVVENKIDVYLGIKAL